jgi:uncharacterized protein (TIGR00645 family)
MASSTHLYDFVSLLGTDRHNYNSTLHSICSGVNEHEVKRSTFISFLQVVDLALIANLVVMIIFSGYENFISKIDVAKDDRDRPDWMGSVDFSDLKIKLVASILAISGIGLLETFLKIAGSGDLAVSEVEIKWMVIIHIIFIISGLLLAMMDYVAHRSSKH